MRQAKIFLLFTFFTFALQASVLPNTDEYFFKKCKEIDRFLVKNSYTLECFSRYQHFNARSANNHYRQSQALKNGKVKIASFNMLHPGSNKASFKDLELMAKIINNWDIVAAQELVPLEGDYQRSNDEIVKEIDAKNLKLTSDKTLSLEEVESIKYSIAKLSRLYRAPGYLLLLEELRKLDPSWALIMSPYGEAGNPTSTHELVGYYYRGKNVKPKLDKHCEEFKGDSKGRSFGCFPEFSKKFLNNDYTKVFSRRPFLASFQSGNFDFALLTSHVIYTSPRDPQKMKEILRPTFGVDSYEGLGVGVNKATYARFAEVKAAMDFLKRYQKEYSEEDLIFLGDFNLKATNRFWKTFFSDFDGWSLKFEGPTSITPHRFNRNGDETGGLSSNYDHFIVQDQMIKECDVQGDGIKRFNFIKGDIGDLVQKKYIVRNEIKSDGEIKYNILPSKKKYMDTLVDRYRKTVMSAELFLKGDIVPEFKKPEEEIASYEDRIFLRQLSNYTYYRIYKEVLSDHFPIYTSCSNKIDND